MTHGRLARALPDLADVKLSHVWTGQCAGTFDVMPHIGCHDGICVPYPALLSRRSVVPAAGDALLRLEGRKARAKARALTVRKTMSLPAAAWPQSPDAHRTGAVEGLTWFPAPLVCPTAAAP